MRLYVPTKVEALQAARLTKGGASWSVPAGFACAVTPALSAQHPDEDQEGLEWLAFCDAAHMSLGQLVADPSVTPLRVVVSVDVASVEVSLVTDVGSDAVADAAHAETSTAEAWDDASASLVRVGQVIADAPVAAVHVDEAQAAADVTALSALLDQLEALDHVGGDVAATHGSEVRSAVTAEAEAYGHTMNQPGEDQPGQLAGENKGEGAGDDALSEAVYRVAERDLLWFDATEICDITPMAGA